MWPMVTSAIWLISTLFSRIQSVVCKFSPIQSQKFQKTLVNSSAAKTTKKAKFTTGNPPEVDQCVYQNPSVLPPPPPPPQLSHLRRASPLLGMIHKHKGPSSPARGTINLGLMSDAGEAAASKRAINNSPACVYTPSLTTGIEKPGRSHSKFDSFDLLHAGNKDVWMQTLRVGDLQTTTDALWPNKECITLWNDYRENQQQKDGFQE